MRIIERKDAKYLLFGILEISEKKRENHSNSEKKHFERKEASQMCLASFHIKRDTEKSISANLGIFLPRQCPCSRTTVLKNTRRQPFFFFLIPRSGCGRITVFSLHINSREKSGERHAAKNTVYYAEKQGCRQDTHKCAKMSIHAVPCIVIHIFTYTCQVHLY